MSYKLFILLNFYFISCFSISISAQTQNYEGIVKDKNGEEIPGVSVLIKGTNNGTITDLDGNFSIQANINDILQFSFIGYVTKEVKLSSQQNLSVMLVEDAQELEEIVVVAVGYGDVRRRDLTGSIGKANIEDLTKSPTMNIAGSLGGRVAGVNVTSSDGGLEDNFNIVIRGAGSLTQSTAPLYVIDGFPYESSNMSSLNPNDIESIDILKDASATAIYGSRGANGVIIITTKQGKSEKIAVNYNGNFTVGRVRNTPELMNGYDFVRLQNEVMDQAKFEQYYFKNGLTSVEDYKNVPSYNWQDEIYRTALSQSHHLSLSGQSKAGLRFSSSFSFNDQQGVIINSGITRYQGRVNLMSKIGKKLQINANANFASTLQKGPTPSTETSAMSTAWMYSVWGYRPVSPSGSALKDELYDEDIDMSNDYRFNPVLSAQNEYRRRRINYLAANISAEYEIIKNLKVKVAGGYTSRNYRNEEFNGSKTRTGNSHPQNTQSRGINALRYEREDLSYLNENTISYQYRKKKHNLNALAGITFQKSTLNIHSIQTDHITNESFGMAGLDKGNTPVVFSSKGENTLMSYLARVNYNYQSKYYATLSFRADGSSKFPTSNRWGYFPSGSLAWNFQRENWMKERAEWLSNGKLRASWGMTGNNRVGNYDYMAQLMTDSNNYQYGFDSVMNNGYVLNAMANKKLKWETTEQTDIGVDLGFFNGRLNLTLDYYIKTTKDLLLAADVPASSGFTTAIINVGKIRNKGLEITLESTNIQKENFTWTSNFNIAFNQNRVLSLNSGQQEMYSSIPWDNHYRNTSAYVSRVGESAGKMYGYIYEGTYKLDEFDIVTNSSGEKTYKLKDGIPYYSTNTQPGDPKYKNLTEGDLIINEDDKTVIGNGQPLHTGGFTNNFRYKNWELNVFLQWSYGNDIFNINRLVFENVSDRLNTNMFASYNDRWTFDNTESNMPRARANGSKEYSSLYVEDGSYLKLKSITLSYNFPKLHLNKYRIDAARIFVSAENIATLTSYSGPDPEVSTRPSVLTPGFDWSAYPRAFNASVGVSLTF